MKSSSNHGRLIGHQRLRPQIASSRRWDISTRICCSFPLMSAKSCLANDPVSLLFLGVTVVVNFSLVWCLEFLSLGGSFLGSLPSTLLNPFHVRYDTLLKRWDQHYKLVELEIALLAGRQQMEATERIEMILMKFIQVGMFEDKSTNSDWRNMGKCAATSTLLSHSANHRQIRSGIVLRSGSTLLPGSDCLRSRRASVNLTVRSGF